MNTTSAPTSVLNTQSALPNRFLLYIVIALGVCSVISSFIWGLLALYSRQDMRALALNQQIALASQQGNADIVMAGAEGCEDSAGEIIQLNNEEYFRLKDNTLD